MSEEQRKIVDPRVSVMWAEREAVRSFMAETQRALAKLAEGAAAHDPLRWRRSQLRRIWKESYPGMSRAAAARAIALEWLDAVADTGAEPEPGSPAESLRKMTAAGQSPLAWRTIADDLDADLDR
ncbi:hypothetical protein L1787_17860 [Acuticoccus sp. M5D2P5]|uniref:hypothetical protein n=1 Tax=Acuticoccus kalidii TaxID=2910977 RepID=UPI001F26D88F|nr:hypothetical protein [Acuticoccus kalidii]MCF3935269.1 hypothetical protein [Acuticoccus kalidii]